MAGVTHSFYMLSVTHIVLEYSWERKGREAREAELAWRVKRNIVDVAISFIWYATICLLHYLLSQREEIGFGYRQQWL